MFMFIVYFFKVEKILWYVLLKFDLFVKKTIGVVCVIFIG